MNESNDNCQDCKPIGPVIEPTRPKCVPSRYCASEIVSGQCKTFNPPDQVQRNMISPSCETSPLHLEHHKTLSPKKMPNHQPRICSLSSSPTEASSLEASKSTCSSGIQPCVKYRPPFVSRVLSKPPPEILLVSSSGRPFVTPVTNAQSESAVSQSSPVLCKFRECKPDLPNQQRDAYLQPASSHKPCAPILNSVTCPIPVAPSRPSVSYYPLVPCSVSGPSQPPFEFYNSLPEKNQLSAPCTFSNNLLLPCQAVPCRQCVPYCQPNITYITPYDPCKQSFELGEPPCKLCTPCGICLNTPHYEPCNPCSFPSVPCRPCFESFIPSCELVCGTPIQYSCNTRVLPGFVPICDQCIPSSVPYSRPCGMNGSCCVLNPENCSLQKNEPPFCCAGNVVNLPDLSPMSLVPSKEVK